VLALETVEAAHLHCNPCRTVESEQSFDLILRALIMEVVPDLLSDRSVADADGRSAKWERRTWYLTRVLPSVLLVHPLRLLCARLPAVLAGLRDAMMHLASSF
jgi:hypothetical protein